MNNLPKISVLKELNQLNPNGFGIKVKEMTKEANQRESWLAEIFLEQRICYLIQCASVDAWRAAFEGKSLTKFNPRNMLKNACFDENVLVDVKMINVAMKLEEKGFNVIDDVNNDGWCFIKLRSEVSDTEAKESLKAYLDDFLYNSDEICGDEIAEKAKPMIKKLKKCLKDL